LTTELPAWLFWLTPAMATAIAANIWNRIRGGLNQARQR
jgi:hypothetical protein